MGNDYRGVDRLSGMRIVPYRARLAFTLMNHGGPGNFSPGRIVKQTLILGPRTLTLDHFTVNGIMPMVMSLTTNSTVATRAATIKIWGLDQYGQVVTETLSVTGATAAASQTLMADHFAFGTQMFTRITRVDLVSQENGQAATAFPGELADTVKLGPSFLFNPRLGLPCPIGSTDDVLSVTLQEVYIPSGIVGAGVFALDLLNDPTGPHASVNVAGQYVELLNTGSNPLLNYIALRGASAVYDVNMLIRTSIGFTSGSPAYGTSDIYMPSSAPG